MSSIIPSPEQMTSLLGASLYEVWAQWTYEYKYRRGGKTLCALYAREHCMGFMVILGKEERLKFEHDREHYAEEVQRIYEGSRTYHDGKWMMFELTDMSLFDDFMRLLRIKRKPNRS